MSHLVRVSIDPQRLIHLSFPFDARSPRQSTTLPSLHLFPPRIPENQRTEDALASSAPRARLSLSLARLPRARIARTASLLRHARDRQRLDLSRRHRRRYAVAPSSRPSRSVLESVATPNENHPESESESNQSESELGRSNDRTIEPNRTRLAAHSLARLLDRRSFAREVCGRATGDDVRRCAVNLPNMNSDRDGSHRQRCVVCVRTGRLFRIALTCTKSVSMCGFFLCVYHANVFSFYN